MRPIELNGRQRHRGHPDQSPEAIAIRKAAWRQEQNALTALLPPITCSTCARETPAQFCHWIGSGARRVNTGTCRSCALKAGH